MGRWLVGQDIEYLYFLRLKNNKYYRILARLKLA